MIESAVRGGPLILFENQSCIRDHIFIDDVIAAFLAAGIAGERARGEYFIIGTGVGYRISEVVELIADRVGFHTGERPTIECDRAMRLEAVAWRNFVADSSRFRDLCGWSTEVSLVDGIDRTVECCINRMRVKEAEGCGS
jgi:nucleoside-diphosphate-sugar epimerase